MEPFGRMGSSRPAAALTVILAVATLAPAQTWNGRVAKEGDVTVVLNPGEPIIKAPLVELKRDWTAGGDAAAGRPGLAKPWDIALDDEGRLYVLDIQDASIKVFDPQGAYVRTIGRRGQGPGEIGAAFSILVPWRARTLIVNDAGGRRLSFFSLDGVFEKNLPLRGLTESPAVDSRFDIFLKTTDIRNGRESLNKMNADLTAVLARIFDEPVDESHNPFKPRARWVLDAQDRLILGRARAYEFEIYDSDGRLSRKIRREYSPLKVTKADIDEFLQRGSPPGFKPTYSYSSHHACYRGFFVDDQGRLFVQTWERNAANTEDIHDVFDAEGRYLGRVAMPRHEDLINPTTRIARNGRFYAIELDAEGNAVVRRYSMNWLVR